MSYRNKDFTLYPKKGMLSFCKTPAGGSLEHKIISLTFVHAPISSVLSASAALQTGSSSHAPATKSMNK